ncbi:MAG: hypothetical protein KF819_15425 [Labilithrix sp.]|nr:hypothetical protein [Labilithrix sp.]
MYGSSPPPSPATLSSIPPAPAVGGNASAFLLTPSRDDTSVFNDGRIGFSHLVPGRPTLGAPRPDDPPADAVMHLQDAPITIRYRLEAPAFAAPSAAELAKGMAERYAAWRSQGPVPASAPNDSWLGAWAVEAAAVAAYEVPAGQMREDLFVLVKQGMVLAVSWTYPRGFIDDPAYATFASVAEATMIWDASRENRGRVWPESPFMGPGLFGAPKPQLNETAKQLGASIPPGERAQILAILSGVVSGAGAPWVPLAPAIVEGNKRAILGAVRNATLRGFVEAIFPEIRTAHDLRGIAIVLGRALTASVDERSAPRSLPASPMI